MVFNSRLYLDWDGCVNAPEPQHDLVEEFLIQIEGSINLAPVSRIVYSPTVVQTLDRFRQDYNIELVMLSTWNDREDVLKLFPYVNGLYNARVIEAKLNQQAVDKKEWTQWKADAILADQAVDPKRFAWVDDNAHRFHGDALSLQSADVEHLFLTPNSLWGLTVENLNTLEAFFKNGI